MYVYNALALEVLFGLRKRELSRANPKVPRKTTPGCEGQEKDTKGEGSSDGHCREMGIFERRLGERREFAVIWLRFRQDDIGIKLPKGAETNLLERQVEKSMYSRHWEGKS